MLPFTDLEKRSYSNLWAEQRMMICDPNEIAEEFCASTMAKAALWGAYELEGEEGVGVLLNSLTSFYERLREHPPFKEA